MKFRVKVTLEGCTDLEGRPVVSVLRLEAGSVEEAKEQGLKLFKMSLPAKAEATEEEELPTYE